MVVLIDMALYCWGSPIIDLSIFFFLSISPQMREQHEVFISKTKCTIKLGYFRKLKKMFSLLNTFSFLTNNSLLKLISGRLSRVLSFSSGLLFREVWSWSISLHSQVRQTSWSRKSVTAKSLTWAQTYKTWRRLFRRLDKPI